MSSYLINWSYLGLNQIEYLGFKIGLNICKAPLMVTQSFTCVVDDESIFI